MVALGEGICMSKFPPQQLADAHVMHCVTRWPEGQKGMSLHFDWVLVSEPGVFQVSVHFPGGLIFVARNEAQEQHSLLATIFDYIFYIGPAGKYL